MLSTLPFLPTPKKVSLRTLISPKFGQGESSVSHSPEDLISTGQNPGPALASLCTIWPGSLSPLPHSPDKHLSPAPAKVAT